jgi:hypothetical protein
MSAQLADMRGERDDWEDMDVAVNAVFTGEIEQTLNLFFRLTQADVLEVRRVTPHTTSCFLTPADIAAVANLIVDTDEVAVEATYITLNPVNPGLLTRSHVQFRRVGRGEAVSDADIICRRLLLVDFDPERSPKKVCSTSAEKRAAYERALDCSAWLVGRHGWSAPILADSGNGFHLLFTLAGVPLAEATDRHVAGVLKMLDRHFSDDVVKVDTSVGNPSRITKLYGTWVRKGPPSFERPWRRSSLLEVPEEVLR